MDSLTTPQLNPYIYDVHGRQTLGFHGKGQTSVLMLLWTSSGDLALPSVLKLLWTSSAFAPFQDLVLMLVWTSRSFEHARADAGVD